MADDEDESVYAWLRRDDCGGVAIVVANFTPVPRHGWRLGVPAGPRVWREAVNTDSAHYGGSNLGNGGAVGVQPRPSHGHAQSVELTLPPLATLILVPG